MPIDSQLTETNSLLLSIQKLDGRPCGTDKFSVDLAAHFVVGSSLLHSILNCLLLNRIGPSALLIDLTSLCTLDHVATFLGHDVEVLRGCKGSIYSYLIAMIVRAISLEHPRRRILITILVATLLSSSTEKTEAGTIVFVICKEVLATWTQKAAWREEGALLRCLPYFRLRFYFLLAPLNSNQINLVGL